MCMKTANGGNGSASVKNFRLPQTVVPSRYDITLEPDLKAFTFCGFETIEIDVTEPTSKIVINSKEIAIQEVYVEDASGTRLVGTVDVDAKTGDAGDPETELATITFAGVLGKGSWKLFCRFTGQLNDKLKGFYRSFWKDDKGEKHPIATTQFESTDARRAFPCFDEPEFKATYKVTLVVDENLAAISNGRILSTHSLSSKQGKKAVCFAETMKMSTYLVCFIVGEFVSSEPVLVNGKELRVWCVPGKEKLTGFALRSAAFSLDWYEKYFRIPYPGGDKIDFIAIPDFASGAMENLGCITFRETALLADEATATHAELERVAVVVKHELAHMWFGDLVTMRWWNGLWLNESFATFMENKCLHAWRPEWKVWDGFGLSRAAAARVDSLKSTHPIESPVVHPDDAQELFDVISYEKGCSTLYQIEQFIGEEVFRDGISAYLKKHSYGNTETHDLWDALEESCRAHGLDIPVRKIMDAWVFTAGHPVVEVESTDADGFVKLSQRAFQFLPAEGKENTTLWPVPVTLKVKGADGTCETKKFLLEGKSQKVFVGEGFQWVVVNAGGSGFYRVRYGKDLALKLTANVQENLSVIERFNLVNDSWACVRARIASAPDYLSTISLFAGETDPNVWAIILGSLRTMHSLMAGAHRQAVKQVVRDLVKPTADKLGWVPAADESVQTKQLRGSVMSVMGTIGKDEAVRAKAKELFASWKKDKATVDANVVPAIVGILAWNGDKSLYDEFFTMSKDAKTPQEVQRFLFALAGFRDTALLDKTIAAALSEEVRSQDAPYLFASLIGNEYCGEAAWKFMVANWDKMVKAYPENGVVRMCGAVSALDTPELEKEVVAFFAKTKVTAGEMAVAQALEQLRINVLLRENETPKLQAHLAAAVPAAFAQPVTVGGGAPNTGVSDPPKASSQADGHADEN